MTSVSRLLCARALPSLLVASLLACADEPDPDALSASASPTDRQAQVSPPVTIDADDPTCGLPASDAHLMEVAHADAIVGIARVGNRVLSQDKRRWVLWDVETRKVIASGPVSATFRMVDLVGAVALTPTEDGRDLELRSAEDGKVTARIELGSDAPGTRLLARDGSYVYVGTSASLRVFDPTGRLLFQRAGDYSRIATYAAPSELRVAQWASPGIEVFSLTGERTLAKSFAGFFGAWFVDGKHFTTTAADGVRVFTAAGELVRFFAQAVPRTPEDARVATAGDGPFVWMQEATSPYKFRGRRITDGSAIESVEGALASGPNLARVAFYSPPAQPVKELRIFEVRSASYPGESRVPADAALSSGLSIDAAGNWASGGYRGEVHVSRTNRNTTPLPLGCARPLAIAGARNRTAVLTSDGRIRVFDLVEGKPRWLRTLDVLQDSYTAELAFAADGRYLVVHRRLRGDVLAHASVYVFDLALERPGEPAPLVELRYGTDGEYVDSVVTPHGDQIAISSCRGGASDGTPTMCEVHVSKLDGSMHWQTPRFEKLASMSLSPRGDVVAVTSQPYVQGLAWFQVPYYTLLFDAQKGLVQTVRDTQVGTFLDADRLLVHAGLGVRVIGLDGTTLASPAGKLLNDWAPISSDDPAYFVQRAYVHRAEDGAIVWRPTALLQPITPEAELKNLELRVTGFAVAGDYAVVGIDAFVHAERYR